MIGWCTFTLFFAQNGWTALIWAADNGHLEVVEVLLQAGVDVNIQDKVHCRGFIAEPIRQNLFCTLLCLFAQEGQSALMHATKRGYFQVVQFLLQSGADRDLLGKVSSIVRCVRLQEAFRVIVLALRYNRIETLRCTWRQLRKSGTSSVKLQQVTIPSPFSCMCRKVLTILFSLTFISKQE